jgi:hypothetical protein
MLGGRVGVKRRGGRGEKSKKMSVKVGLPSKRTGRGVARGWLKERMPCMTMNRT